MIDIRADPAITIARLRRRECNVSANALMIRQRSVAPRAPQSNRLAITVPRTLAATQIDRQRMPSPQAHCAERCEKTRSTTATTAINAETALSPPPPSSPTSDDDLPDINDFLARAAAKPVTELPDRQHTMERVIDARREPHRETRYKIEWSKGKVPARMVHRKDDGTKYTRTNGKDYAIRRDSTVAPLDDISEAFRDVEWEPTWEPASALSNAQEAVADYHRRQRSNNLGPTSSGTRAQDATEAATSAASSSPLRVRDHEAESAAVAAAGDRSTHLPQADLSKLQFTPVLGHDHALAIRGLIQETFTDKPQSWQDDPIRQPVLFRDSWGVKLIDLYDTDKRRPTMAHMVGIEQVKACGRCVKELGPFQQCVVAVGLGKGACANCVYAGSGRDCNFHNNPNPGTTRRRPCLTPRPLPPVRAPVADRTQVAPPSSSSSSSVESAGGAAASQSSIQATTPGGRRKRTVWTPPTSDSDSDLDSDSDADSDSPLAPAPAVNGTTPRRLKRAASNAELSTPAKKAAKLPTPRAASTAVHDIQPGSASRMNVIHGDDSSRHDDTVMRISIYSATASSNVTPNGLSSDTSRTSAHTSSPPPNERKERVRKPAFRHDSCDLGDVPCTNPTASYTIAHHRAGSSRCLGFVPPDKQFKESEATPANVRYIIHHCDCATAQRLEDAWQAYNAYVVEKKKFAHHTKESYISHVFVDELNRAIRLFIRDPVTIDLTAVD